MRKLGSLLFASLIVSAFALAPLAFAQSTGFGGGGGGPVGVQLQSSTPGAVQTGNANISGNVIAGTLSSRYGAQNSGVDVAGGNIAAAYVTLHNGATNNTEDMLINYVKGNTTSIWQLGALGNGACGGTNGFFCLWNPVLNGTAFFVDAGTNVITASRGLAISNGTLSTSAVASVSFGTPLGQTSGGTGAGTLTCSAGQYLTSNGTAYSCSTPSTGTGFVTVGQVSSAGAVVSTGGTTYSVAKGAVGKYTVTLAGLTTGGVITGTVLEGASPGYSFTATPGTGSFTVSVVNGANGLVDAGFMFVVAKL